MRSTADHVSTQPFLHTFGQPAHTVTATNIIANFFPQQKKRVLLCAHWDCRHWADQDPDPEKRTMPVPGANDGASGVAVLLEIAQLLKQHKPPVGIDMVFFDGEDQGTSADDRSYAKGSAVFAKQLLPSYRPLFGILLDLIGDSDLQIFQEMYSIEYARPIVDQVWQTAEKLGIDAFVPKPGYAVFDDHVPLLERGIPCIDIIDFDYPYWHTVSDTPDKCSPESLEKVGKVVLHVIYTL
ncbi:M28 family peptidase [candidate division KSB1 bacterium]|nr:M28 family peptidase [candidate division KSB1 bacterium]